MFHEAATRGWDEDELRQLAAIRAPLPLRQAAIDGNAKLQCAAWQPALPL